MSNVTDSDRLLAQGAVVHLTDGREVPLRYNMRALKMLEDRFGTIEGVNTAIPVDDEGRPTGKVFGPMLDLLIPGLLHTGLSEDELIDLLDPKRLDEYGTALGAAMAEAFPAPKSAQGNGAGPAGVANGSPGPSSTGPQPVTTAVPTESSGP